MVRKDDEDYDSEEENLNYDGEEEDDGEQEKDGLKEDE